MNRGEMGDMLLGYDERGRSGTIKGGSGAMQRRRFVGKWVDRDVTAIAHVPA